MGDDSERLHLEGLDEATERERWEEHFAAPTDLPDAETAWEAWHHPHSITDHKGSFLAGFAAASGPWEAHLASKWAADKQSEIARLSEQLDAAKRDGQIEVARAFQAWAATNEIAENIDWKWFGEICRRYSDIYEGAANE